MRLANGARGGWVPGFQWFPVPFRACRAVLSAIAGAEAEARRAVDEWIAAGNACAASPGASAIGMFEIDQKMLGRIAAAYEVETPDVAAWWSACGLAWARGSLDATFGLSTWMMPWASADIRALMLQRMTERFGEAAITAFRARSKLS